MSPVSKVRRKTRSTIASSSNAKQMDYRTYRRREQLRKAGYVLIAAGIAIALEHAAAHLGAFDRREPSTLIDLTLGWPLAMVVVIIGMILAGQRR